MPEVKPELPAPRAQTAVCVCGAARSQEDPPVIFPHVVSGMRGRSVKRRNDIVHDTFPPTVRACRACGVLYVGQLAGVPDT